MFNSLSDLRARAWKDLESARVLLESDPDRAAYLAGYSIEIMLKGRYAELKAWRDFPELPEIRNRGAREIVGHDLEALVALAKAEGLKTGAMLEVDWDLVKQWNVSQRYSAVGVLTRSEVERRLNETEKAYHQIVDFTVLDRLVEIEEALTKRFGLFNFFGFVEDRRTNGWELWYSMWARHNGQALVHSDVEKALAERLDEDVKAAIARVVGFHPDAPIIRAYNEMAMMMGGMVHSRILLKQCIVVTFGILPNAYVIANGRWAETLLSESWGEATG